MSSKVRYSILGCLLLVWLVAVSFNLFWRKNEIGGLWKNDYYGACLCDSNNFYQFKEGRIHFYSDLHLTDYDAGSYESLGGGRYRVSLKLYGGDSDWVVRPGKNSWFHPPDEDVGFFRSRARKFYRLNDEEEELLLISSAEERDRKLEIALERSRVERERRKLAKELERQPEKELTVEPVQGEQSVPPKSDRAGGELVDG